MPLSGKYRLYPMHLSLIIPVYKNRATLRALCREITQVLTASGHNDDTYEIILVDDASPDGAWEEIKTLSEAPNISGLRHKKNEGQHAAVITGFHVAKGEWLVALDGDLQDPPHAITELLAAAKPGIDVVFAARRGIYQSLPRMITSKLYRVVMAMLLPLPGHAGMFFALRRTRLEEILSLPAYGAALIARMGLAKLPYASVSVARSRRTVGRSAYTSLGRLKTFLRFMLAVTANRLGFGHSAPLFDVAEKCHQNRAQQ